MVTFLPDTHSNSTFLLPNNTGIVTAEPVDMASFAINRQVWVGKPAIGILIVPAPGEERTSFIQFTDIEICCFGDFIS